MDHDEIRENHVLERYLAGRLSEDEVERFETHLLECPACYDETRWGEDFRAAVRKAAAEDRARATATVGAGLLAWLAHRSQARRWTVLLGGALLAVVPAAWLLWKQERLQHELSLARAAAVQAEQPVREPALRPVDTPAPSAEETAMRRSLEAELRSQREARALLEAELQRLSRPQAVGLISLGLVRGAGADAGGPEIRLDPGAGPTVLSVELPPAEFPAYRATLLDSKGERLWRGDRLEPSLYETLLISIPSRFLTPGSYRLRLEGLEEGRAAAPAGEVRFRLLPPV